ncbi:MAG TPA: carboxypeptidase-like regulatory domain-containing protein, partial [Thermoanaerobaculia bacterium]
LDDNARHRELDVKVDAGRSIAIVVIDKENDPVANAQVFAVADAKLRSRTTTDEDGRATVALPAGEAATLFIVPEEGPFGVHRVARESEKGRMQVYLPRTPSSLLIRAQTTNGATLPPFSLLMRFNGDLLPLAVAEELGVQLMTDANSEARLENIPTGSYEFWPYRTESEAASIIAAATALVAPIQVQVKTGENKIAVTFAAKVAARR